MGPGEVLDNKAYLSRIREWPAIPAEANPRRWLDAFAPEHQAHAIALLDSLVFVSAKQARKLFTSAFHALSSEITAGERGYANKRSTWRDFLDTVLVSAPTGESPNPTDSGHIFQRLARTELRIEESRVVDASDLRPLVEIGGLAPIVMVDDFLGSGNQFVDTWTRDYWVGSPSSLKELVDTYKLEVFYIPLIATTYALEYLEQEAPSVKVRPCHVLTDVYSAGDPASVVFPPDLRADAPAFIQDASSAAGLTTDPRGFHELELAIAFEHGGPDASLGLIWSEENGWFPLVAKT